MGETVNAFEVLEKVTGIDRKEQMKILEEIRENNKRLGSCNLHDFSIEIPQKYSKYDMKYQCKYCEGIVDSNRKLWYEKGLAHGSHMLS